MMGHSAPQQQSSIMRVSALFQLKSSPTSASRLPHAEQTMWVSRLESRSASGHGWPLDHDRVAAAMIGALGQRLAQAGHRACWKR